MTPRDDFPYEMLGHWLDADTADRLLSGAVSPDDAPQGFQDVAEVVRSLAVPPTGRELQDERRSVATAIRVLNGSPHSSPVPRRSPMRSKLTRAKIAGLVVVGTLVGTTGMAAANVLPDPAQTAVSNALSRVGIDVPTGIDHPAATGEEISQIATTTDATGVAKGAEISTTASGGMSQAGQHGADVEGAAHTGGSADGSAVVATPNAGGTGTADGASGEADGTGSGTADQESGGHADERSANATATPAVP